MPTVRAIIFDLDNCLTPGNEVGPAFYEPAFAAIRRANEGTLGEAQLDAAFSDLWRHAFDVVAQRHGFSEAMFAAGWRAFANMEVDFPMHGYPDLDALAGLPVPQFLVTTGFRRLQESKITALGLHQRFRQIRIDVVDEPGRVGKQQLFREIAAEHTLEPARTLVVGDNPESEIAAGNALGMRTVQILRPGVSFGANASHHIHGLRELAGLLQ